MSAAATCQPSRADMDRVDRLIQRYRADVRTTLEPLVASCYPALQKNRRNEYRKMVELSTKMMLVAHAATNVLGHPYDRRRRQIASLFGGCCFLADSFIDDFGDQAAFEYLDRFETLLTRGWFHPRTQRERLFYAIITRLFLQRHVLQPTLRQAVLLLYEAQRRDVEMRSVPPSRRSRRQQLYRLKMCARDRSGHALLTLSSFLVPEIPLAQRTPMFLAGSLIMHIDDHGDAYADLRDRRVTYMNQMRRPARALRRIFEAELAQLERGLPPNSGRQLLIAFLTRYFVTRLHKHQQQRKLKGGAWAVYE